MSKPIYVFGEGKTEEIMWERLKKSMNVEGSFHNVEGKDRFGKTMKAVLSPLVEQGDPDQRVSVLVFRDVDVGERKESICQSFRHIVEQIYPAQMDFEPLDQFPNVLVASTPTTVRVPGFLLVLHLADNVPPGLAVVNNKTTDAYILTLALIDEVLEEFAEKAKIGRNQTTKIKQKVLEEIPGLFKDNGIPFDSEKDYLAAFLLSSRFWAVGRTDEETRLVRVVLDRALDHAAQKTWGVLASWKAAVEEANR